MRRTFVLTKLRNGEGQKKRMKHKTIAEKVDETHNQKGNNQDKKVPLDS